MTVQTEWGILCASWGEPTPPSDRYFFTELDVSQCILRSDILPSAEAHGVRGKQNCIVLTGEVVESANGAMVLRIGDSLGMLETAADWPDLTGKSICIQINDVTLYAI